MKTPSPAARACADRILRNAVDYLGVTIEPSSRARIAALIDEAVGPLVEAADDYWHDRENPGESRHLLEAMARWTKEAK